MLMLTHLVAFCNVIACLSRSWLVGMYNSTVRIWASKPQRFYRSQLMPTAPNQSFTAISFVMDAAAHDDALSLPEASRPFQLASLLGRKKLNRFEYSPNTTCKWVYTFGYMYMLHTYINMCIYIYAPLYIYTYKRRRGCANSITL
jgi:hypothetical protein